jgi:hypothetical protein
MKKLIGIILFASLSFAVSAQGLLRPIQKNLFRIETQKLQLASPDVKVEAVTSLWVLRLQAGVTGTSYGKNPETKELEITPLSAICAGISYLHYSNADGVPFNDFGFSALILQNTQRPGIGLGLYGTYNTGQVGLLNLGAHYDFNVKQVFVDVGLTFHY